MQGKTPYISSGARSKIYNSGETEDLRRFNLEFSFPTPDVTGVGAGGNVMEHDSEDFVLDAIDPQVDPMLHSSDSIAGGEGFESAMQELFSEIGPVSEIPQTSEAKGRKQQRLSRHGIPVPSLPSGVVKKLAIRFARTGSGGKTRIDKETLAAIEKATEWFFEQASEDLATYSKHAGRKTIDETDVITLMRR
jgi:histone H3/H4